MTSLIKQNRVSTALKESFAYHIQYYRAHHRTKGCKVTHMIGIPMIAASVLIFPWNRKASAKLQFWGWVLQFIGHFCFEHNTPVILELRDPMTAVAALSFVAKEWRNLLQRKPI